MRNLTWPFMLQQAVLGSRLKAICWLPMSGIFILWNIISENSSPEISSTEFTHLGNFTSRKTYPQKFVPRKSHLQEFSTPEVLIPRKSHLVEFISPENPIPGNFDPQEISFQEFSSLGNLLPRKFLPWQFGPKENSPPGNKLHPKSTGNIIIS